jgi:hypothetical protein
MVNRLELLRFYDDPIPAEKGMDATAVNAVAGEELGLALLMHYFTESGTEVSRLPGTCSTGKSHGHRLDAWVQTPDVLYQVEVKNWSAHSLGGRHLAADADDSTSRTFRAKMWQSYWDAHNSTFFDAAAAKVLEPMAPPHHRSPVEPLVAFWVAIHPLGEGDPFFSYPLVGKLFEHVHVFSMSNYLRGLTDEFIRLPLPKTRRRIEIMRRLFGYELA